MRYFEVEAEYMGGETYRYPVNSDGTRGGEIYNVDGEDTPNRLLVGYSVMEYTEAGMLVNVEFYPVKTDTSTNGIDEYGVIYKNNGEKVLEQIKAEHDPAEWQNNMW